MKLLYERWRRFLSEAEVEEGIDPNTNQHDGRYYAFDWDDNLLFMPTKIYLTKGGKKVGIGTEEFAHIRTKIGKEGEYKDYSFSPDSFRDFRVEGNRQFLKDVSAGPRVAKAWPDFVEAINTASVFAIITARGHSPKTLKKAVKILIDMNYEGIDKDKIENSLTHYAKLKGKDKANTIDKYLNMCRFYPVSYGVTDGAANPEQLKVSAMNNFRNYVNDLNQKLGINAAPTVKLGFSDDDRKNFELMRSTFPDITSKYTGPEGDQT